MSKINVTLGFDADTSQAQRRINELATSLRQLSAHPVELLDDTDLRDAIKAAKELETHLHKAYNVDTQKLDLSKFSKSLSAAGQDLNYFQKNLSKMGVDGEKAFLNLAKAIATADAPTFRLSGHVKNLFDELVKVGRWQFTSSVMHNLTGAVQTAYHYAQDLNESLTNIRIVTGQSTEEMAQFADKANAAAKALSTTTVKYSDAALIYYQQGLDEQQIEERTAITIKMANAAGQSVETVSDQLTSIWNNYYDGSKSLEYYADVLARLGADTASSSDEITEGLEKFSSVADTVGLSYEYAASALATVTATTRESANIVGTAFKTLFSRIQGLQLGDTLDDGTDLNKYSAALASVGVNIKDTNGDLKEMDTILDEVGARWNVLSKDQQMALAQTVAGVRQYTQFIALMDNWDYFQENLNSALNATGSLNEQTESYAEGWEAAEDRVRASAEGIYKALIDEETFIDLNNGLASVLQGVDGVVTGMGGMKGVLTTIGSLFLMTYSKEIPSAIDKAIGTLDILTGKAKKNMAVMQQQNINALTEFTGGERSAQVEADGLAKVARMKKELTDKSHMLSKAQIEEYQSKIQSVQGNYQKVQALYEEAEAQENLLERAEINYDQKMTRSVKDLALSLNDSWNQMENLANRFAQEEDENIITSIIEDMNTLQKRIKDTNETLKSLGLNDEEILTFRTNFDPTQKKQAEEVDVIYKKITKSIEEQRKKIVSLTKEQEKYRIIGKAVEDMKTVWDKNTNSVDKAKQAIKEYLKDLEAISKKENIKIDFSEDSMIGQFLIDLDKAELSADQLKQRFSEVLEEILKVNAEGIADTNADMEVLENQVRTILNLMGQGDKFDSFLEVLRTQGEEAAMASLKASMAEEELKKQQEERIKVQAKLSSGIGEMAAQLMNINGLLASVGSISRLWNDEDASALEKITATMGLLYQQGQLVVGMYKAMTTVGEALTAIKSKKAIAEAADAAATKINTEITEENTKEVAKNKLMVLSHPYLLIASAVLMTIVTVIGAISAAWEKDAEAAKEAAEAANKAVEKAKDQVKTNTDLVRSMEELLSKYEETGEGKEELDEITNSLAEAYDIEGAALAKLSGKYENYQAVLDKAKQKQIEELKGYKKETEQAQSYQKENILYSMADNIGEFESGQYKITFKGTRESWDETKNEEKKAVEILNKTLTGSKINSFFVSSANWSTNSITTSLDGNIESIIQFYEELKKAKSEMDNQMSETEIVTSEVYQQTSQWLDRMGESIETYKAHKSTIAAIDAKLNNTEVDVNNYSDYTKWAKQVREELGKTITDSTELEEAFQAIIDFSSNSKLSGFQELESAIETIKLSSKVSSKELEHQFDLLSKGESKWSQQTLLTLDWAHLTETTWKEAADALEAYYDSMEKVQSVEETKAKAQNTLDLIKDGVTRENSAEILAAFDWGKLDENGKQAIIEYSDFLKLTLEEQQEYLTQFTETSLTGSLQNQIEYNTEEIERYKTYLKDSFNLNYNDIDSYLEKLNKLANFKNWTKDASESAYLLRRDEVAWTDLGFDGPVDFADIKNSTSDDGQKIQELLDSYEEILNIKNKISNLSIANKDLEEQKKIEAYFKNNEATAKRIIDQLKLDEIDFILNPDDSRFQQVIDDIVNSDPSVRILVEGEMDESLLKLKEDTEAWMAAASMIGEDYQVAADNIDELAAKFPGILEGYEIVSGEMIRLNGEQVQSAIYNAEKEIEANKIKQVNILQLELESLKKDKEILLNKQENISKALKGEEDSYNLLYSLAKGYSQEATDKMEGNVEAVAETTDKENKNTADSYAKLYNSALQNYVEYIDKMAEYTRAKLKYEGLRDRMGADGFTEEEKSLLAQELKELTKLKQEINSEYKIADTSTEEEEGQSKTVKDYAQQYFAQNETIWEEELKTIEAQIAETDKEIAILEASINAIDVQTEASKRLLSSIGTGEGTGKSSSKDNKAELSEETYVYETINNIIDDINYKLKEQEKLISSLPEGSAEYIAALEQQKKLLDMQIEAYKTRKDLADQDMKNIRIQLEAYGMEDYFLEDGIIDETRLNEKLKEEVNQKIIEAGNNADNEEVKAATERKEKILSLVDAYKQARDYYRESLSAITEAEYEKANIDLQTLETAKKKLEEEQKLLEDEIKAEEDRLKKNFEYLETELNINIQINENTLKKLDYYIEKLSDDLYAMAEAGQYLLDKVGVNQNSLDVYKDFYNKLEAEFASGNINQEDYRDGLQTTYDGILDNLSALTDLDKEMTHYYGETLSAAKEELTEYTDSLEHLTSVLEHYKNIVELVDGEYNFDAIDVILRGQAKTIENQMRISQSNYEMLLQEKEAIEASLNSVELGSKAWELFDKQLKDITKAVEEAEEEMLSKTEEWAEAMKAVMENTFAEAAYKMEMSMTEGMGFDALNSSLDRLNAKQEVYLTATNRVYEITKLMRTAQQAADKTDNITSKQKLNNFTKEISSLKDETNLSKLDLEIAQARYDVLLAEIALEEAQRAKSVVRLQRDSEGNFGYVYTADNEAISSAEQDLADAQNKLYNIRLDATNDYGEKLLDLEQQLAQDLSQLEQDLANGRFQTETEYNDAVKRLKEEYYDLFIAYSDQYTEAQKEDAAVQQEAWINAYQSMIDQAYNWETYTVEYTNSCKKAYDDWRKSVVENNELVQNILNNTSEEVDKVTTTSDNLKNTVLGEVIPAISDELEAVRELTSRYGEQREEIYLMIEAYEELIEKIKEKLAAEGQKQIEESKLYDVSNIKDFSQAMADYLEVEGHSTSDAEYQALLAGREEKLKQQEYAQYGGTDAVNLQTLMAKYERYKRKGVTNDLTEYVEYINRNEEKYFDPQRVLELISSFASGGYTGSWGPSGRLAVLHQKELVLNANDTLHFLQAAEILRGVSEAIDLQAMANQIMLNPYAGALTSSLADQTLQQQVTIEANFPGVTDRFEIEEAFNNLINTASQYANRK